MRPPSGSPTRLSPAAAPLQVPPLVQYLFTCTRCTYSTGKPSESSQHFQDTGHPMSRGAVPSAPGPELAKLAELLEQVSYAGEYLEELLGEAVDALVPMQREFRDQLYQETAGSLIRVRRELLTLRTLRRMLAALDAGGTIPLLTLVKLEDRPEELQAVASQLAGLGWELVEFRAPQGFVAREVATGALETSKRPEVLLERIQDMVEHAEGKSAAGVEVAHG